MSGLAHTLAALARSRNDAATATLLAALDGPNQAVQVGVIGALIDRRSKAAHDAAVARWHTLSTDERSCFERGRGRMGAALREGLLGEDEQLFANACAIAELLLDFDLTPTLLTLVEHADPRRREPALRLLRQLVAQLEAMTHASRDARDRQNTDMLRDGVLESLHRSIERFRQHRRSEVVEAFVTLAGPNNPSLREILDAPHHPCFAAVVEIFTRSENRAVVGLMISLLTVAEVPQVLRSIAGKRTDDFFTTELLSTRFDWKEHVVAKALHRIKSLSCLETGRYDCSHRPVAQQVHAVELLMMTSVADEQKLDLLEQTLAGGAEPARLVACQALASIVGQRANELALRALGDAHPGVQAAAVAQIRQRHIPGAISLLLELTAHADEQVRSAARRALPEFTVDGLLTNYDDLAEGQRRTTAELAARVDPGAADRLRTELSAPLPRRRLRAVEIAQLAGLAPQVADGLVERLQDEDHLVRAAAATALEACTGGDVRDALLSALGDRSPGVQAAARESLSSQERRAGGSAGEPRFAAGGRR